MFCTSCGFALDDTDRYCAQCGKPAREPANADPNPWQRKRLTRSMSDKNVAGVCSGFARYLEVDVTLIRILWLAGTIFSGGIGLILYVACWLIMPKDYAQVPHGEATPAAV